MGVAAILVMWPRPFEQTFVPPFSIWNLSSIGQVVSEMFENVDGRWMDAGEEQRTLESLVY